MPVAAIQLDGRPAVFWYANFTMGPAEDIGHLAYARYDGTRWVQGILDGFNAPSRPSADDVGGDPTALWYRGQPHLFYGGYLLRSGGYIRHAWRVNGTWHFENLTGVASTRIAAAAYQDRLHLWYAARGRLEHQWMSGASWRRETLDGPGGTNGRLSASIGGTPSVVIDHGNPHAFYYDATHGNLRQAWWTGSRWMFHTLDGTPGPQGRREGDVGGWVSAVTDHGYAQAFYYDATRGDLRVAWYDSTLRRWRRRRPRQRHRRPRDHRRR